MTVRWNIKQRRNIEIGAVDRFIEDIVAVCKKYDMSIAHEGEHGVFIVKRLSQRDIAWLRAAHTETEELTTSHDAK